jgi:hypothetical protein
MRVGKFIVISSYFLSNWSTEIPSKVMASLTSLCEDEIQHISKFIFQPEDLVCLSRTCVRVRRFIFHPAVLKPLLIRHIVPKQETYLFKYDFHELLFDVFELHARRKEIAELLGWYKSFPLHHQAIFATKLYKIKDDMQQVKDQSKVKKKELVIIMDKNKLYWRALYHYRVTK